MKKVLNYFLAIGLFVSFTHSIAEKVINWEVEYQKVERDYRKGDYKMALSKSQLFVKKIEKSLGNESLIRARALAQMAKIYEGLSRFEDYKTSIDLSVNTLNLASKDNMEEYAKALSSIAEAYIQYGDFLNAQITIDKAFKLIEEGKIENLVLSDEIKGKQVLINYHQGYLVKADKMIVDPINFRKARVVRKEAYRDEKQRLKQKKLTGTEYKMRARSASELMNLHSLIAIENGNYLKADSILEMTASFIKINLGKKDVTYVENIFQKAMLLTIFDKHFDANKKYEKAAKATLKTKGVKWRQMSKPAIRIQEGLIVSHKISKRDAQSRKREKIFETRVIRTYGKNTAYYAIDQLLEAECYLIAKEPKKAAQKVNEVLNNPLYFPKNHPQRLSALELSYVVLLGSDKYEEAEACLSQIADITKVLYGSNAPIFHMANLDLANFYVTYSSKFKKAEEIYSVSYDIVKKEIDHRNKNFLGYCYSDGELFEYTDRFEKALEVLLPAQEETKKYYGEKSPKYASALERVANIYIDLGKYAEAEKNLNLASEIFRKEASTGDYTDYSHALETFARLYIIQGQYDDAEKVLRKAVKKQSVVGADVKLSGAIEEKATLLIETGKYQGTDKNLKEALSLKEAKYGKVHRSLINPLNQLGHLNQITGNYIEAEKYAKRAASISVHIFGESSIKFAESLKLLGKIYSDIGDFEKAEEATSKALVIMKQQYGNNHVQVAMTLNDIALIKYNIDPESTEVEKLLLEALKITKDDLGDKHPSYASILTNLGSFYLGSGKIEKAENNLNQANAIWVGKFGESNVHSAEIFYIKGNVSLKKKNYQQARTEYSNSKNIYQRVFDNSNHPGYLTSLSKVGQMDYILADYKSSVKNLDEVTSSHLLFIQNYFPALSEREKTKFWKNIQKDFEFYNNLAVKLQNENPALISNAYNFSLATKALLLNSSIKVRQRIMESNDPSLIKKFEEWVGKKEFLTSVISMTSEQMKEAQIDLKSLEAEIETLEKELSSRSEAFAQNYQKKQAYDWKNIKKNLKENEAAVEIIRFRQFDKQFTDTVLYAALIITPETKSSPTMVLLKNGVDLEKKWLKYYRNCMKYNVEDKSSFNNFWKPIQEQLKENMVVYFSPDGVYNQINLETMQSSGKYVLDKNQIVLVSNTRDLISRQIQAEKEKEKSKKSKNAVAKLDEGKVVLFGNPIYYSKSFSVKNDEDESLVDSLLKRDVEDPNKRLSQLPGAEKEVKDLNDLLQKSGWNSEMYISESASEAKLKELKNVKVFHIATHGFFLKDEETLTEDGINQNQAVLNPLLKSGLLLKDGGYLLEHDNVYEFNSADGILTAYEAMNLNFDNTELVVLSACETGLGEVQLGEGVYGLQRSFLVAGSKTVIMSLFKVSDEVTQELMTTFYGNWIATGNKRQAFIDAKKAIKDKYKRPIYWGAFIMIGLD